MQELTVAVIVVTYSRPEYLRRCLTDVLSQTVAPQEIIVVDSSPNDLTTSLVATFPGVKYLRNALGMGHMATSRVLGVAASTSAIVAFIDDDAYAEPQWLEELLKPYADPGVAGVGGRARNNQPGEDRAGSDQVGLLLPDGRLTGNFAAVTDGNVEVDHLIGCNMSYRRSALQQIDGIHDHWPGTSLREDADTGLRLRRAGFRLIYAPEAAVLHVGGTYAKGRRFDLRYTYYGARNHIVLLRHALGPAAPETRAYSRALRDDVRHELRYAVGALGDSERSVPRKARGFANGLARASVICAGSVAGLVASRNVQLGRDHPSTKLGLETQRG